MASLSMIVIDANNNSREEMKALLGQFHQINLIGVFDNLLAGYESTVLEKPHIVYIDLSENVDLGIETIEKICAKNKNTVVFVSSETINTEVVIKAMSAGAREFIIRPIRAEDLSNSLNKAKVLLEGDDKDTSGRVISVFSNKGGIGKTTIATNLALKLTELTEKRVCLVDLNLQLGDVTTFLDVDPSFDISYVVTHISRIDESFLLSSLERYKDKDLYILADPPNIEQAEDITAEDIVSVISMLKDLFAYVIIDTSSSFDIKTFTCLDVSDTILLVSMINLPAIRNTQRCLDIFQRLEYRPEKIKLIVNRHMENDEISVSDVEEALGCEVYWKIPNDYATAMSAINKGIPISESSPNSVINSNLTKFAAKISDVVVRSGDNSESDDEESGSSFGLGALKKFKFLNFLNK